MTTLSRPCLSLGNLVCTRGVNDTVAEDAAFALFVYQSVKRHGRYDYGDLCDEDKALNDEAVLIGGRIFSAYVKGNVKIWIITEADRSATTILFPDEY
jgi:hypothetical protein